MAVVGEFKQGKSALINSVLGAALCPVDDHVATARVTVVSHGETPAVIVRSTGDDGQPVTEVVDPSLRTTLITEASAGDGVATDAGRSPQGAVHRIDLRIPSPLLANGIVLVDTPGVGGVTDAHAAATRGFLSSADAVVFVTAATSELTESELAFLAEVSAHCPHVVVALTKIDLFAHWRRVLELDRGHLATAGIDAPVFPVSYPLRVDALQPGAVDVDPSGTDAAASESGYPELLAHLLDVVVPDARAAAERRSVAEIVELLRAASAVDRRELRALDEPSSTDADLETLRSARDRIAALAAGGARWRTVLGDAVTDVSQEVTFRFRDRIRSALGDLETAVDEADDGRELDAAVDVLRDRVVAAVQAGFDEIEAGVDRVTSSVAATLGLDELPIETFDPSDVSSAAIASAFGDDDDVDASITGDVFSALRGAQGGILMIAVMGSLLPAAAAATVAAAPFMIGAGVLFGGKSIVDVRRQRRQRERQRVKLAARKGVDDVQFRVGNELGDALRAAQRHLRDELGSRIEELQRTTAETIERLERSTTADAAEREHRRSELAQRLSVTDSLLDGPMP